MTEMKREEEKHSKEGEMIKGETNTRLDKEKEITRGEVRKKEKKRLK